jgi:hypothetical protein
MLSGAVPGKWNGRGTQAVSALDHWQAEKVRIVREEAGKKMSSA